MLLALLACAECPRFDELVVTDPEGLDADLVGVIEAAVDGFATWTGREGVCVPEVRVVSEAWADTWGIVGQYRGPHDPIYLSTASEHPFRSTLHELCHALDHEEELHESRPDLFPVDAVEQDIHYFTDHQRGTEAFARACEGGPFPDALVRDVLDACGFERASDAEWFVQREVYRDVRANVSHVPVRIERRALADTSGDIVALGADGTGPVALQVYRDPARHGDGWIAPPALVRFDAVTGAPDTVVALPVEHDDDDVRWSIVSGEGEVIVIEARAVTRAWRFDMDARTRTLLSGFPITTDWGALYGVVADGAAWVTNAEDWHRPRTLWRHDLASGVTTTIGWPEGIHDNPQVYHWAARDGRVVGVTLDGSVLVRDVAAESWEVTRPVQSLYLRGVSFQGDTLVLVARERVETGEAPTSVDFLVLHDLVTGEWALPEEPCVTSALDHPFVVTLGGEPWIWEHGETRTLGRVVVGEPG